MHMEEWESEINKKKKKRKTGIKRKNRAMTYRTPTVSEVTDAIEVTIQYDTLFNMGFMLSLIS